MAYKPRPYQLQAIESNELFLAKRGYTSIVDHMACGLGKTAVAVWTNEKQFDPIDHRTLFLVDQRQIVKQTIKAYQRFWPELVKNTWTRYGWQGLGMVMGEHNDCSARVAVATPQTLDEPGRLEEVLKFGDFSFVIYDEAHTAISRRTLELHEKLKSANPKLKALGLTATPMRHDGKALGLLFEHIAVKYDIRWGIKNGYLCNVLDPLEIQTNIEIPNPKPGATIEETAARALDVANWNQILHEGWYKHAQERQGVVWFMPSVQHSYEFCLFMQSHGVRIAHVESGRCIDFEGNEVPEKHRDRILSEYDEWGGQLTNYNVLSTGWDAPHTDCICVGRPTENTVLQTQWVGRGTRKSEGSRNLRPKQDLLILDFGLAGLSVIAVGTLLGSDLEAAKQPTEAEEETLSEGVSTLETDDGQDVTITGKGLIVKVGNLFKRRKEAWFEDIENNRSVQCSGTVMLFVHPPDYVKAGKLRPAMEALNDPAVITAYDFFSGYSLWRLDKMDNRWIIPMSWVYCDPNVEMLFDFIAPLQEELMDPGLAKKNTQWRKSSAPPSEDQMKFISNLGRDFERLKLDPVWERPATKGEAAQIITHMQCITKLHPVFKQILANANKAIRAAKASQSA